MDVTTESAATANTTIPALFARNATEHRDHPALTDGDRTWTWGEADREVRALAAGFAALGLKPGQTVVLMMSNRAEQWLADVAVTHLGAVPAAVHPALSSGEVHFVAQHSRARMVVLENAQHVRRSSAALREQEGLEHVIVLDETAVPDEDPRFQTWRSLRARGERELDRDPALVQRHAEEVRPGAPAAVLYSPDSFGQQSGVVLTHRNVLTAAAARHCLTQAPANATTICYLSMAHMSERATSLYSAIHDAAHVHFCNGIAQAVEALPTLRPHTFFGVPRVWEKLAAKLRDLPPGHTAGAKRELLSALGLDATTWGASGAAPIDRDVLDAFAEIGFEVFESWGLTEASGWATSNRPSANRPGSVGRALPGVEIRTDGDGEVLIRGPVVCAGHLQADGVIRSATDSDGWLRTGDIGSIDEDGYLTITDRKSELIVNSSGESVAPSLVEKALRAHPLIGHALAFGEGRPHVVALLVLDEDAAPAWARARGIRSTGLADLAGHPDVLAEVDRAVADANAALGPSDQVRGHRLLDRTWGAEGGELTPTLKLRRRLIHDKYADVLDSLYA